MSKQSLVWKGVIKFCKLLREERVTRKFLTYDVCSVVVSWLTRVTTQSPYSPKGRDFQNWPVGIRDCGVTSRSETYHSKVNLKHRRYLAGNDTEIVWQNRKTSTCTRAMEFTANTSNSSKVKLCFTSAWSKTDVKKPWVTGCSAVENMSISRR